MLKVLSYTSSGITKMDYHTIALNLWFIIIAVDYFTKLVEAEPFTNITEAKLISLSKKMLFVVRNLKLYYLK